MYIKFIDAKDDNERSFQQHELLNCYFDLANKVETALAQGDSQEVANALNDLQLEYENTSVGWTEQRMAYDEYYYKTIEKVPISIDTGRVITAEDVREKIDVFRVLGKLTGSKDPSGNVDKYLEERIKGIVSEIASEETQLDIRTTRKTLDANKGLILCWIKLIKEKLFYMIRQKYRENVATYIENVKKVLQAKPVNNIIPPYFGVMHFMLQNKQYDNILDFSNSFKKSTYSSADKINYFGRMISGFDETDIVQLILKYRIYSDWEMYSGARKILNRIAVDFPVYAAHNLVSDYLKNPEAARKSLSAENLQKMYLAVQAPHMDLLLNCQPDLLEKAAEELRVIVGIEQELPETDQVPWTDVLLSKAPNSIEISHNAKTGNMNKSVFETGVLPEIKNSGKYTIDITQLKSSNPIVQYFQQIKTEFDGVNNLKVIFNSGRRRIETSIDLDSMEMTILNPDEVKFSSKEAQKEMIRLLCNIYIELGVKQEYKDDDKYGQINTAKQADYEGQLLSLFRKNGESPRVRKIMQFEYNKGRLPSVEMQIPKEFSDRNPFEAQYFQMTQENGKFIYTPLFDLPWEEAKSMPDVVTLGYIHPYVRQLPLGQKAGQTVVREYLTNELCPPGEEVDVATVDELELALMLGNTENDYILVNPNTQELTLVVAIRTVKDGNSVKYVFNPATFVSGFIKHYLVNPRLRPTAQAQN